MPARPWTRPLVSAAPARRGRRSDAVAGTRRRQSRAEVGSRHASATSSPSTEDATPGERLRVGGRGRRGVARGWRWRSIRRWSGRRWKPTRGWSARRQLARWRPTRGRRRWPVLANRPYLGFRAPWVGWEGRRGEAREGDTGMPAGGLEMHWGWAAASGGPGRGLAARRAGSTI
jgi:hypothetical protein